MAKILLMQGIFCARIELANEDPQGRCPGEENIGKDVWRLKGIGLLPPDRAITSRIATLTNTK